jgi:hypothetical protein
MESHLVESCSIFEVFLRNAKFPTFCGLSLKSCRKAFKFQYDAKTRTVVVLLQLSFKPKHLSTHGHGCCSSHLPICYAEQYRVANQILESMNGKSPTWRSYDTQNSS